MIGNRAIATAVWSPDASEKGCLASSALTG